jgi:hypothetical protein
VPYVNRARARCVAHASVRQGRCRSCSHQFLPWDAVVRQHAVVCAGLGVLSPEQIVRARKRLGLTQQQLATASGFGIASIRRWETGVKVQNVSSDRLLRVVLKLHRA